MEAAGHGETKELVGPAHLAGEDAAAAQAKLYEEVGRLKMELDWGKNTCFFG